MCGLVNFGVIFVDFGNDNVLFIIGCGLCRVAGDMWKVVYRWEGYVNVLCGIDVYVTNKCSICISEIGRLQ